MEEFDTMADGHGRLFDGTEPMGETVITYNDLLEALKTKKPYMVPVRDQTNDQVLFVKIEVLEE
jgi:hypothetical protein